MARFMGEEPQEVHEHFDAEGNPTGRTVVTREPEWDDEQRQVVMSKLEYDRNVHHGCGTHVSKSMDESVARLVEHERVACLDCEAIDAARRKYHASKRHTDETCDCRDHVFYIAEYRPI